MHRIIVRVQGGPGATLQEAVATLDLVKGRLLAGASHGASSCGNVGFDFEASEVDAAHAVRHLLPRRGDDRQREIQRQLRALGYRMEHSLAAFDGEGHAIVEIASGESVEIDDPAILALATEWSLLEGVADQEFHEPPSSL